MEKAARWTLGREPGAAFAVQYFQHDAPLCDRAVMGFSDGMDVRGGRFSVAGVPQRFRVLDADYWS